MKRTESQHPPWHVCRYKPGGRKLGRMVVGSRGVSGIVGYRYESRTVSMLQNDLETARRLGPLKDLVTVLSMQQLLRLGRVTRTSNGCSAIVSQFG
jgi:hypothetical protein